MFIFRASCRLQDGKSQKDPREIDPAAYVASISAGSSCSFAHPSLIEKSTVPKYSSFWVYWPLFSVFIFRSLESWNTYFCLIYLTPLLNLYHHACLFQLTGISHSGAVAVKGNDSRISHGPGSSQHGKRTKLMSPRALSLAQVSPFHWAQQISHHICGVWHCKRVQSGDTNFYTLASLFMFKPTSLA